LYRGGTLIYSGASTAYNDYGSDAPTITGGSTVASDGTSTAHVALSLSGTTNTDGTSKNYRCYLTASGATAQYSAENTGYRGKGELTYQWQRYDGSSWGNLSGATSSTYNDTSAPAPTITPGTATATFGEWTNRIELTNPGIANNNGAPKNYRCYLTASPATAQYSAENTGYRSTGASACQWLMSTADADSNYVNVASATTINYTYSPGPNDKHYFKLMITASPAASAASTPAIGRRSNGLYLFNG
jgi:hypothetical protein